MLCFRKAALCVLTFCILGASASPLRAKRADCQATADSYTTGAQTSDGETAASQQYQVENSC